LSPNSESYEKKLHSDPHIYMYITKLTFIYVSYLLKDYPLRKQVLILS